MLFNSDHYYTGKNRHKTCEDYAVSGPEPLPYAIVSDGCSSSPGSHTGAMILTLTARKLIRERFSAQNGPETVNEPALEYENFGNAVIQEAAKITRSLHLPDTVLDATLLTAWQNGKRISVFAYGDGFVIAKKRECPQIRIVDISFESNAPYYLSYRLDENRRQVYEQETGGKIQIRSQGESLSLPYHAPLLYHFPVEEYAFVIIASDGFSSFTGNTGLLPSAGIIGDFTAFKNYAGEFIRKRAKRAVSAYEKQAVINTDDLSLAGIYALPEKEEA